eukprot:917095-Alexandrium_andersonii.AAC.1
MVRDCSVVSCEARAGRPLATMSCSEILARLSAARDLLQRARGAPQHAVASSGQVQVLMSLLGHWPDEACS